MLRLLDDDLNRGASDSVDETDSELFKDDYESMNAGQEIDPETESYSSNNPAGGRPSNFDDSGYNSPNSENYSDPEFQTQYQADRRGNLIAQAKKAMKQAQAKAFRTVPKKIGEAMGDKHMFKDGSDAGREKAKAEARKKARKFARDKIAKKIGDKGLATGFKKGLSKETGALAKGAAKKVAGKAAAKVAAKGTAQVATKGAQTAISAAGAATGAETFGLGFLLAFLLNIAISLGVNDAVEAAFELKDGNIKQAYFLAVRAAMKVGMFIYLLLCLVSMFSIAGIFIAVPLLVFLNIYMIAGFAFKKIPQLQGLVWWEIAIIILADLFAFLILVTFIGALGWWLCNESGLGAGGVKGTVAGMIVSVYDWWNETNSGSVAADFCKYVKNGS